ncbi:MAG: hypothetical protein AAF901_11370, partial [Bacteroidota bacterium]
MKKVLLLLCLCPLFCLFNCTEEIGSFAFTEVETREFSVSNPEIGTFNFKQEYSPGTTINNVMTSVKLVSSMNNNTVIPFEVITFKDSSKTYNNIAFTKRDTIRVNQGGYKVLDTESGSLLSTDQTLLSVFDPSDDITNLSGHYEGTCKVIQGSNVEDIFNVYGNIDINNNLLLLSMQGGVSIDYIRGFYIPTTGEFSGTAFKDETSLGNISNEDSPEAIEISAETNTISDELNLTVGETTKQLVLTLIKT